MSKLTQALSSLQASIAEALLAGALTGSVSTGLTTLLAENPQLTLSEAITNVNNDISTYLGNAIAKLPGWEQVIAQILLVAETPNIQSWVDGIITQTYTKLVSQLAGTAAGQAIVSAGPAAAPAVPPAPGEATSAFEQSSADGNLAYAIPAGDGSPAPDPVPTG